MKLIDLLHAIDLKILHFSNTSLAGPACDILLKLWSSEAPWFILAAFFFLQTAYRRQWQNFRTLLWLGATVGVSDAFAAQIIKPLVGRIRPCRVEGLVRIVDGCAGSLGFPSNHAANGAAFALFWFLWKGPRIGSLALVCALMVGFSRVYLGMHYPSDVLGGFLLGGLIGSISFAIFKRTGIGEKKGAVEPLS